MPARGRSIKGVGQLGGGGSIKGQAKSNVGVAGGETLRKRKRKIKKKEKESFCEDWRSRLSLDRVEVVEGSDDVEEVGVGSVGGDSGGYRASYGLEELGVDVG
ncbi:hypothetical protein FNV43_RR10548 [Rhamnella rubrinervis]|uniref:Uncharacterized protein n=1 Tax=Rhamnella rubrinervis TaxID=2594499 RepID=A0A8K0MGX6_9ROSA|nr:hypothetical protein FNV43_RR10548 [Rhamnella rubrinervis]